MGTDSHDHKPGVTDTIRKDIEPIPVVKQKTPSEIGRQKTQVLSNTSAENVRARVRKSARGLLLRRAIFLCGGILLGVGLVIYLPYRNAARLTSVRPVDSGTISVVAGGEESPALGSDTAGIPIRSVDGNIISKNDDRMLNAEAALKGREIRLEERKYLYLSGTQRSYAPQFISETTYPKEAGTNKNSLMEMKPVAGSPGRYTVGEEGIAWQGSWDYEDPAKNVKLGTAYKKYLEDTMEGPLNQNLSVLAPPPANLLKNGHRLGHEPSGAK